MTKRIDNIEPLNRREKDELARIRREILIAEMAKEFVKAGMEKWLDSSLSGLKVDVALGVDRLSCLVLALESAQEYFSVKYMGEKKDGVL